jgi:HemK-related putative methylase
MNNLTRLFIRMSLPLRRRLLRRRLGRLVIEEIDVVPLVVLPQAFNPVVFRTGTLLARTVASSPDADPGGQPGARALDMGTGSGVGAVFAARRGYSVAAVDVNPEAVRCARINALLNGLEAKIDVFEGDLFAPVEHEEFDLVLFNPPFFRGQPKTPLDAAWRGVNVMERFAQGLPDMLGPGGRALIVLSTDGEPGLILKALSDQGFDLTVSAEKDLGNEVLTVYCARSSASPAVREAEHLLRSGRPSHPSDDS